MVGGWIGRVVVFSLAISPPNIQDKRPHQPTANLRRELPKHDPGQEHTKRQRGEDDTIHRRAYQIGAVDAHEPSPPAQKVIANRVDRTSRGKGGEAGNGNLPSVAVEPP